MTWASAVSQLAAIEAGDVSPSELRDQGIERCERLDPQLGFLATDLFDRAPSGIPMLLKDAGQEIAGTPHWVGVAALRDAGCRSMSTTPLPERFEHAGFSIIGKSACPPLSNGVTTEPPGFAPTRNPWDVGMSVGGSSGGAAAAVACGAVPIAHGSDATGSLRFPAALCGVATLVPTAGTIESVAPAGQPPSPWWRDFVLARDARDLELMLGLLAPESSPAPVVARQRRASVLDHDPELGMVVEPECRQAVRTVAALLEDLGWVVDERWPPALDSLWQRVGAALGVVSDATRPPVFEWVAGRLGRRLTEDELPAEVFAAAARDAGRSTEDRSKAGATIEAVVAPIADWFREVDVLITPATFQAGWPLGIEPGVTQCGTLAAPFSLSGHPSVVVPVPLTPGRAPVGVQIVGRHGSDGALLRLLIELQDCFDWLAHRPDIFA